MTNNIAELHEHSMNPIQDNIHTQDNKHAGHMLQSICNSTRHPSRDDNLTRQNCLTISTQNWPTNLLFRQDAGHLWRSDPRVGQVSGRALGWSSASSPGEGGWVNFKQLIHGFGFGVSGLWGCHGFLLRGLY